MLIKVQCPECKTRYKLDDARIQGKGARITCPKCRHVFVLMREDIKSDTDDNNELDIQDEATVHASASPRAMAMLEKAGITLPPPPAPEPPPAPAAPQVVRPKHVDELSWKEVGITTFKVKVGIGLVYDFSDVSTLKKYIQEKRVAQTDRVSFDGKNWTVLKDIPQLDTFFIDQWVAMKQERLQGGEKAEAPKEGKSGGKSDKDKDKKGAGPTGPRTAWTADAELEDEMKGIFGINNAASSTGSEEKAAGTGQGAARKAPAQEANSAAARRAEGAANAMSSSRVNEPVSRPNPVMTAPPPAMSMASQQRAGSRFGRLEMLVMLVLAGISGFLAFRLMNESVGTPVKDAVELKVAEKEFDQLLAKHFPIAMSASKGGDQKVETPEKAVEKGEGTTKKGNTSKK